MTTKKTNRRSRAKAVAFTKFHVLGNLYAMKTLAKRAEHAYGDLGLGSAIKSLNVAIRKIREGQDVINPLIPYDE